VALVIVVFGSLLGEMFGVYQLLGKLWFWFGHQGWEYLELGRAWQILLAIGLILWLILIFRGSHPARKNPEEHEISTLFLLAALAIPLFYLPALFFTGKTHFTVVDNWRFGLSICGWKGFFELFVTTMVAVLFYKLGMVTRQTATRVIYLDAILFLGGGISERPITGIGQGNQTSPWLSLPRFPPWRWSRSPCSHLTLGTSSSCPRENVTSAAKRSLFRTSGHFTL